MSQEADIMFEMERQRREQLFLARVRNKTQEFYLRYRKQYDDMLKQGYDAYIPDEMRRFNQDLNTVESLLQSNPAAAREVSQEIGSYIHSLWGLGKEAQRTFHETARLERARIKQEQAQKQSETLTHYYEVLSGLDSIAATFAARELETIKQGILAGNISSIQELDTKLQPILSNATKQAQAWREQKKSEQGKQAVVAQIEEQKAVVQAEKFEDKAKAQAILDKLEEIKKRAVAGNISGEDANKQIADVAKETDETLTDENVRREMVKAIYKWFNAHDFTVSKPRVVDGSVLLTAKRPSGNRAQFKLGLDNKMTYQLDGYEGQSCLKDIASAKSDWETVYGFVFKDEVIKRQNPDRILRQQNRTVSSRGGNM